MKSAKYNFVMKEFDGNAEVPPDLRRSVPPVRVIPDGIEFSDAGGINLAATLDCGQAFRWSAWPDGVFRGVVRGALRGVSLDGCALRIYGATVAEAGFWAEYFALDADYDAIHRLLSRDSTLRQCVDFCPGIRVLRQDFFETLVTFIISSQNNIPRIRGIVERLCGAYGKKAGCLPDGAAVFSFPEAGVLAGLAVEDLACLRAGFRAPWIIDAARKVVSGDVSEENLTGLCDSELRKRLMSVCGVGRKVADCTALFGLGRFAAFPVDVWMGRAMERMFPQGLPDDVLPVAGIAQQYIFNFARCSGEF